MQDEEKLRYAKDAFITKINNIETWDQFKSTVQSITSTAVSNFLKNNIQKYADSLTESSIGAATVASGLEAMKSEL